MLRVGSVRWKGKCSRHPAYDPEADGPGAIKGGCQRCTLLLEIHGHHQQLVKLIRQFGTREEKPRPAGEGAEGRQLSLLD